MGWFSDSDRYPSRSNGPAGVVAGPLLGPNLVKGCLYSVLSRVSRSSRAACPGGHMAYLRGIDTKNRTSREPRIKDNKRRNRDVLSSISALSSGGQREHATFRLWQPGCRSQR
jgi:hypothetical protein